MKTKVLLIVLLLVVVLVIAACVAQQGEEPAGAGIGTTTMRGLKVQNAADIGGNLVVGGAVDIAGNPSYGAKDLRPVGNPSNGKILMMGVTSAVVQSATVVPTVQGMATVTAFGCEPDDAAFGGAWNCRAAMGASNTITFTLYNAASTPVPTAAWDEIRYWVAGN